MGFVQKELKNAMTLYYLMKLDRKVPTDNKTIKKKQNKKLFQLMKAAYEIPFYRDRFDSNNLTPDDFHCAEDLEKFPILTRNDLRKWMQDVIQKDPSLLEKCQVYGTSGSSGVPLRFLLSQRETACMNASWIRVLMYAGHRPLRGRMLTFLTTHQKVDPKKGDSWIQRLGFMNRKIVPEHLYVGEGMKDLIELVNEYRPDTICFRKNVLVRMAIYARNHGMKIYNPKAYTPVSEMVDEITRNLLLETFGPGLFDAYGCNETGNCAVKLPGSDVFYVYNDTHVLNIVDDENRLADDGRLIGTALYKKDFPIINYEIGDTATSEMRDGVRYIKTIKGRTNDLVQHADGVETSAAELYKIFHGSDGVAQFRFVQDRIDEFRILLVKDPINTKTTREDIEKLVTEKIEALYGDSEYRLRFEWMDEIPPDENGKMRCFVCNVPKM